MALIASDCAPSSYWSMAGSSVTAMGGLWPFNDGAGPHNMDCPPKDGPNYLGLRYNMLTEHQMALIASGCVPLRPGARHAELRRLPLHLGQHDPVHFKLRL